MPPPPRRFVAGLLFAGALCAVALPALSAPDPEEDREAERGAREVAEAAPRLAVSDGARGRVTVVDLADGRALKRFALAAPAGLVAAGDGRHAIAAMGPRNRLKVIDVGSWAVSHGDHAHHYVRPPRVRATIVARRPSHVVPHGPAVGIFGDGDGVATVVRLEAIHRGARGALRVRTGTPHHGVAVPAGARTLVSVQTPGAADSLPGHLAVADPAGRLGKRRIACAGLHGEAGLGRRVVFACADGYLVVDDAPAGLRARRIAPIPGLAPDVRSYTVVTAEGLPYAVGDLDERTLARIDPAAGAAAAIPIPAARGAFALDAASRSLLVVTVDGALRQIDPLTGAVRGSVDAVAPFSLEGGFSVPRPRIAVGPGHRAYVSDPGGGRVVEVATNPLRVTRSFPVGGAPVGMVVLGAER